LCDDGGGLIRRHFANESFLVVARCAGRHISRGICDPDVLGVSLRPALA
jgi:hypothetical protein